MFVNWSHHVFASFSAFFFKVLEIRNWKLIRSLQYWSWQELSVLLEPCSVQLSAMVHRAALNVRSSVSRHTDITLPSALLPVAFCYFLNPASFLCCFSFICCFALLFFPLLCCMRAVEPQPEPLMEQLRKGPSQPWEHRWRQFSSVAGRGRAWLPLSWSSFEGWLPRGKGFFLAVSPLWGLFCGCKSLEVSGWAVLFLPS